MIVKRASLLRNHQTKGIRLCLLASALSLLFACAHTIEQDLINEITFKNLTTDTLSDVTIAVPATGWLMSCNIILINSECSMGFPDRKDRKNNVVFSWRQNNNQYQLDLRKTVSTYLANPGVAKVIVYIKDQGNVETVVMP